MAEKKDRFARTITVENRRARFEYQFLDEYTAGLVLTGTEIKSIRQGKANLSDSYCLFLNGELYVRGVNIARYDEGTYNNHEPLRDRKLLLEKREIRRLIEKLKDVGLTIVPTRMYINEKGFVKLNIALAKGKKTYDKRDDIKERDVKREMSRREE